MTLPYKIGAGILALLLIVGVSAYLWAHHDNKQQAIGAAACINSSQSEAVVQTQKTGEDNLANAETLSKAVAIYDQKIRDLNDTADNLAQRLHDSEAANLRASAVPNLSAPAGFVCTPADTGKPSDRDRREAEELEACANNTIELISIRSAWTALHDQSIRK